MNEQIEIESIRMDSNGFEWIDCKSESEIVVCESHWTNHIQVNYIQVNHIRVNHIERFKIALLSEHCRRIRKESFLLKFAMRTIRNRRTARYSQYVLQCVHLLYPYCTLTQCAHTLKSNR